MNLLDQPTAADLRFFASALGFVVVSLAFFAAAATNTLPHPPIPTPIISILTGSSLDSEPSPGKIELSAFND